MSSCLCFLKNQFSTSNCSSLTVSQKTMPLMYDNNFGKMWTNFQNSSPAIINSRLTLTYNVGAMHQVDLDGERKQAHEIQQQHLLTASTDADEGSQMLVLKSLGMPKLSQESVRLTWSLSSAVLLCAVSFEIPQNCSKLRAKSP